jgi:hypothetical protein
MSCRLAYGDVEHGRCPRSRLCEPMCESWRKTDQMPWSDIMEESLNAAASPESEEAHPLPWEQQPGETGRQHAAFLEYQAQHPL